MSGELLATFPLERIRGLAEEAGRAIMTFYRSGNWSVNAKPDDSPVTQADLAANDILVPGLNGLGVAPVISEECAPLSCSPSERFWLVDPLDGTKEFIARRDSFVISIGLVASEFPVFGLIHAPVSGKTWWAQAGLGCFGPSGQRLRHTSKQNELIVAGSRSMSDDALARLSERFSIKEVLRSGSALKFCALAGGEVDLYPRFGPTNEWDTAGGQVIAEEAGCKVLDLSTGERLRYGKPRFANPAGFMAGRSDLI